MLAASSKSHPIADAMPIATQQPATRKSLRSGSRLSMDACSETLRRACPTTTAKSTNSPNSHNTAPKMNRAGEHEEFVHRWVVSALIAAG
jgi:hypothetical protein